jgi:hypothetical protein
MEMTYAFGDSILWRTKETTVRILVWRKQIQCKEIVAAGIGPKLKQRLRTDFSAPQCFMQSRVTSASFIERIKQAFLGRSNLFRTSIPQYDDTKPMSQVSAKKRGKKVRTGFPERRSCLHPCVSTSNTVSGAQQFQRTGMTMRTVVYDVEVCR